MSICRSKTRRSGTILLVAYLFSFLGTSPAIADSEVNDDGYQILADIKELKNQGRYAAAIDLCREAIIMYSDADEVLRETYNYLGFLHILTQQWGAVDEVARAAVERFPDIRTDESIPGLLNQTYDAMRREMYGSLEVNVTPDSSLVFIDARYVGKTPLKIEYLAVGDYELAIEKPEYEAHSDSISINGAEQRVFSYELRKPKSNTPFYVAGLGVVVGLALAIFGGGDDEPVVEEPLPGPPDPPSN